MSADDTDMYYAMYMNYSKPKKVFCIHCICLISLFCIYPFKQTILNSEVLLRCIVYYSCYKLIIPKRTISLYSVVYIVQKVVSDYFVCLSLINKYLHDDLRHRFILICYVPSGNTSITLWLLRNDTFNSWRSSIKVIWPCSFV